MINLIILTEPEEFGIESTYNLHLDAYVPELVHINMTKTWQYFREDQIHPLNAPLVSKYHTIKLYIEQWYDVGSLDKAVILFQEEFDNKWYVSGLFNKKPSYKSETNMLWYMNIQHCLVIPVSEEISKILDKIVRKNKEIMI